VDEKDALSAKVLERDLLALQVSQPEGREARGEREAPAGGIAVIPRFGSTKTRFERFDPQKQSSLLA
jgi:hypothetical protein